MLPGLNGPLPTMHVRMLIGEEINKRNKMSRGIEPEKKKEARGDNCKFYVMRTANSTCHIKPKAKKEVWNYIEALKSL